MPPLNQQDRALSFLTQQSSLYSGNMPLRTQMLDMQNIPGLGGGLGNILSMAMQPLLMQMTQNAGYAGLQFGGQQNLYDRMQAQDFFLQSRQAVQEAARRDEEYYERRLLGVSRLTGTIVGPEQRQAAHTIAGDIGRMGVIFGDVMPELFDEMHGIRGSAAMMARRIHLGGRYALDPITGEMGLRGDTAGQFSNQIFEELYGPRANLSAMRGFGAGRMGQLYDELQRRGFMGGVGSREGAFLQAFGGTDTRAAAEALLRDPHRHIGISLQEFQNMEARTPGTGVQRVMESTEVRSQITRTEASRMAQRLRGMTSAVAAMRDIFGDMGRPDAPMVELINGLQALTQGGLATMNPQQLDLMVRRTQQLSRVSGITMEGMMQLMSRGAGMADQMGLDRRFSILATQGAAAFGTAFGVTDPGAPGWRMPDKDTVTSLDQSLRMTAARSDMSNQFNATLRLFNEVVTRRPGYNAEHPRSEFEALGRAIQTGQTNYTWGGRERSVVMPMQQWLQIAGAAGIDRDTAFAIRTHTIANQEYGAMYNTGNLSRLLQRQVDIDPFLRTYGELPFRHLGGTRTQTMQMTNRMVDVLWGEDLRGRPIAGGMTNAQRRDPTQRYQIMVRALRQEANRMGLHVTDDQLQQAAMGMWTELEERVGETEGLREQGGLNAIFALHGRAALFGGQAEEARASDRAQLAKALSGLGRGGILRNFMDVLENGDPTRSVGQFIGDVMGGVPREAFGAAITDFNRMYQRYQHIRGDTPQARDARRDLEQQMQHLAERSGLGNINRAQLYSTMFHIGGLRRRYEAITTRMQAPGVTDEEKGRIRAERAGILEQIQTLSVQARDQAEAVGEPISDVDPTHARLTTVLSSTTPPAQLTSMLEAFDRVRDKLRGRTVGGHRIASEADVEQALTRKGSRAEVIKLLGGDSDLNAIDRIINVLRGGEPTADSRTKASDKPLIAKLDGPLHLEGSVELVGNRIVMRDVQTGNHRNPVVNDDNGVI